MDERQLFATHEMRLLHTMLRVGNLQRSIDFYTQVLGMQLLRTSENPEYKYSLAFVGYEGNPAQAEIELTYNWGTDSYEMGTAYGHIALGVPDAYAACDKIKAAGGNVTREAGPVKGGSTVIAFVTDPDGYKIELIQRAEGAAVRDHIAGIFKSWPDLRFEGVRVYAREGVVTQEWTAYATHSQPIKRGEIEVPPSGNRLSWAGVDVIPTENGFIKRKDVYSDSVSILKQLGFMD